jgi:hypothetical protein
MFNRLTLPAICLIFSSCVTHKNPKVPSDGDLGTLAEREKSLIELRVGAEFCQGTLYKANQVLTTEGCVKSGQDIIVRSYKNPSSELQGNVISSSPDGYALIETSGPLEGTPIDLSKINSPEKEPLYFFKTETNQWYLIDTKGEQDFNRQGYRPGTAIFNRDGLLVGQQLFLSNIITPGSLKPFVDDVSSGTIREPSLVNYATVTFGVGLNLSILRNQEGRFSANPRAVLESRFHLKQWWLGLGLYGLGQIKGIGIHTGYRYEWVKTFKSIPLVIEPTIGVLKYPYVGLGLEYGKFGGQLRYYKTEGSDLVEFLWNPLRIIF